ncbi:MAG: glycosyltransferase family 25 protein, partial [Bacillota bacterium]|nr:glycosyltransferase family 25 protein [Bacillota bacterium]
MVSLPRDTQRRSSISAQLERLGIEYEFFNAFWGADFVSEKAKYDPGRARMLEGRELRPGEVGCALSHAGAYARIADGSDPWSLILEDDARLHPDLPAVLERLEQTSLEQGDLVFLERCDHYRPGSARRLLGEYSLVAPIFVRYGSTAQTAGYVVTKEAAEAMRGVNVPVKFPADSWGYYRGSVRMRAVVPSMKLIRQDVGLGSTTQASGTRREFTRYSI